MRTRLKICGLTRAEDVRTALSAGADALGFVLVAGTPRALAVASARDLAGLAPPGVWRVAVVADAGLDELVSVAATGFDAVQLHGQEPPGLLADLAAARPGVRLVKAFRPGPDGYPDPLPYVEHVDAFLLDGPGGGRPFDPAHAEPFLALDVPLVVAGGLVPATVGAAVTRFRPFAVDVASGVEAAPGRKDPDLVRAFAAAVREADARLG